MTSKLRTISLCIFPATHILILISYLTYFWEIDPKVHRSSLGLENESVRRIVALWNILDRTYRPGNNEFEGRRNTKRNLKVMCQGNERFLIVKNDVF